MNAPAQFPAEIHLIPIDLADRVGSEARPVPDSTQPAPVHFPVPHGVSTLAWNMGDVSLSVATGCTIGQSIQLEPLHTRPGEPRLLLAAPLHRHASINGVRAPRVALLAEGDRFHFDPGPAFRVALFHRPRLGPAPSEVVGVCCPICTLPLAEGDRCLVCSCGTPLHAAEDESREGALGCVRMATHCPHCQQPIRLVPAYGERSQPGHE